LPSRIGVTDQGLKHLHGVTGLKELGLPGTLATADRVAAMQRALPKCKILSGRAKK
jgi:hypothetical protein